MSKNEESVALVLQDDPELAMAEANKVEDDEHLKKKLWLMAAKHVIEQEKGGNLLLTGGLQQPNCATEAGDDRCNTCCRQHYISALAQRYGVIDRDEECDV